MLHVHQFLLFIFSCAGVFVAMCELSLVAASRGHSPVAMQWLLLFQRTGSRHAGFSSCSMGAQKLQFEDSRAQAQ